MASIINLTKENFEEMTASGNVLVDFWADWCGPCKMLAPVLDELNEQMEGRAVFAKVNVDDEPELAMKFNVMSIPTVITFKDGTAVKAAIGVQPADVYLEMLAE